MNFRVNSFNDAFRFRGIKGEKQRGFQPVFTSLELKTTKLPKYIRNTEAQLLTCRNNKSELFRKLSEQLLSLKEY